MILSSKVIARTRKLLLKAQREVFVEVFPGELLVKQLLVIFFDEFKLRLILKYTTYV